VTVLELLSRLQSQGARVFVHGGRLRINAPRGAVTPDDEAALAAHRDEIIEFLSLAVRGGDAPAQSLPPAPTMRAHPLSYQQRQLWFLDRLHGPNSIYNVPAVLRLQGLLDPASLTAALRAVIDRHGALRTTFLDVSGEPVQQIDADARIDLETKTVTAQSVIEKATEFCRRPFDLGRDVPVRACLFRLSAESHVLALAFHHIACDDWSLQIVARDLLDAYAAIVRSESLQWHAPATQYADFVHWQRSAAVEERMVLELEFWRDRLKNLPEIADLPFDRPRPARQQHSGGAVQFTIDADATRALRSLAGAHGATLFMVLLAAYYAMLSRISGARDLVVGTPVANRPHQALEQAVGFFANSIVLRAKVAPGRPFVELLRHVRDVTLQAVANQSAPFERVVAAVAPERAASHMPLFQVEFVFQNVPRAVLALPDVMVTPVDVDSDVSKFDLSLGMLEREAGLAGRFEFDGNLFERATIERMSAYYRTLCVSAARDPATPVRRLAMIPAAERQALADAPYLRIGVDGTRVHELFGQHAARTPDAVAIVFRNQSLTYRELDKLADRLAARLRALGVGPECPVGLCLDRSALLFIAMLGILKAGGAYVPLDPIYPRGRLRLMAQQAGARILVTEFALLPGLEDFADTLVVLDERGACASSTGQPTYEHPCAARIQNSLVYVMFTSGSTGSPKGVALQHDVLVNMVRWYATSFPLAPGDRTLQFASIGFDVSFEEAFTCWNTGGTLVVLDEQERMSPRAILGRLTTAAVDRVIIPVGILQAIASEYCADPTSLPPRLRQIITSGSQLQVSDEIRRFCAAMLGCVLHNNYGPAETHAVTREPMGAMPDEWPALPAIGRPILNTQCYVVDPWHEPVPVGVKGELLIGGVAVGRGYVGEPALTATCFVPDPWGGHRGARLYCTGDLVRRGTDGRLTWHGRLDDMVKLRGVRIELGEIEASLRAHPAVQEVAVHVHRAVEGGEQLVAHVVPYDGVVLPPEPSLRAFLEPSLPRFMIPARIVPIAAIPLGPNGKIDRRALPPPAAATASDAPIALTETQAMVAGIWAELLDMAVERIGLHDNFFALGGHSLLVGRMAGRLEAATGLSLGLRTLFEQPTVSEISSRIDLTWLVARVRETKDDAASADAACMDEEITIQ
jgi:amino acid adenylation domain-containing protein